MKRDLLLRALNLETVERPPVWLMRQAGRYMPEYRDLRTKHTLWQLFHEPELAAEVTFLPITLLDVDAAILFSDILVLAEVFGKKIIFPEVGGPFVSPFIETLADIESLIARPVEEVLSYVQKTLQIVKPGLKVPLFGFCAGPFTLATYMIEGAGKNGFAKTKQLIENHPEHFHLLLSKIADASIEYLRKQVKAGADAVQLFDSWASVLSQEQFSSYCLPFWKRIIDGLQDLNVPVIVFCRDSHKFAPLIATISPQCISIDEKGDILAIRKQLGQDIALQGNLSAEFLRDASSEMVALATQKLLHSMQGERGFIMNLGHGVLPLTPVENVQAFVQTVKNFSHI